MRVRPRPVALLLAAVIGLGAAIGTYAATSPALNLGTDGRFTVLLLGSDARAGLDGERTDAMMLVSIDPNTHKVVAGSVPRDMAAYTGTNRFPTTCRTASGAAFDDRLNKLFSCWDRTLSRVGAGKAVKADFARGFGVEVDNYALIKFDGVKRLVDAVGGVTITRTMKYVDNAYQYKIGSRSYTGVTFPAGTYTLNGPRALIYTRTRKGSCRKTSTSTTPVACPEGGSDWGRTQRQQALVMAAVKKAASRGPAVLPSLMGLASKGALMETDIPVTAFPAAFGLLSKADFTGAVRTTFRPSTWAFGIPNSKFAMYISRIRAWADTNLRALTLAQKDTTAPTFKTGSVVQRLGSATTSLARTPVLPVAVTWPAATDVKTGVGRYELAVHRKGSWTYTPVRLQNVLVPSAGTNLSAGTWQFRVRAMDAGGRYSAWKYGTHFTVATLQENAAASASVSSTCTGAGTWKTCSATSAWDGKYRKSAVSGATMELTFKGRAMTVVGTRSSSGGKFNVYLKTGTNSYVKKTAVPVNTYSTSPSYRRVLWSIAGLNPSYTYKLKVVVVAVTGKAVAVDGFGILK